METTTDKPVTAADLFRSADSFTRAYVLTALWSSTEYAYGECPCCGERRLLNRYPEKEFIEQAMCSAEGCGTREIPNPDPMEDNYGVTDFAPATMAELLADCARFQAEHGETISAAIATGEVKCGPDFAEYGRAGHDFWLTRNGHGAGFWDGDWPEPMAKALTDAAKDFGESNLYVGDDGQIYL